MKVMTWSFLLTLAVLQNAQALEIRRWERLPLAVVLNVAQERVIFIDRNLRIGVPTVLEGKLRVQSAGGAVYLLAYQELAPTRLHLQDVDSGALILLDITAQAASPDEPSLEPIRIVEEVSPNMGAASDGYTDKQAPADLPSPLPVVLTRYAAQSLYAPLRTVEPIAGLRAVSLSRDLPLERLMPERPVQYRALAAWRLLNLWVTAVRLRNTSAQCFALDPRQLQGDFIAATFQHPDLGPAGDSSDTTVLYLVTRGHGLDPALLPAMAPIDAGQNLPRSHRDEE